MAEEQKDVGKITPSVGDTGTTSKTEGDNGLISYDTYKKLLNQHKNNIQKSKELESEIQKYRDRDAENERKKLEEEGKYKEIIKATEAELDTWKSKYVDLSTDHINQIKLQAFKSKLPGKVLHDDYLAFVDVDKINIDNDGSIDYDSVQQVVNDFTNKHSRLYDPVKKPKLPNAAPGTSDSLLSYEQWLKLPLTEKRKRMVEVKT